MKVPQNLYAIHGLWARWSSNFDTKKYGTHDIDEKQEIAMYGLGCGMDDEGGNMLQTMRVTWVSGYCDNA